MTSESPRPEHTVGFLGLGAMGLPMAKRIAAAGFPLVAVDVVEAAAARARAAGINAGTDTAALERCELLVVMVATPDQLLSTAELGCITEGVTAIVTSTVGIDAIRAFSAACARRGAATVDCPVTGGITHAEDGTLTLFAAADPVTLSNSRRVLDKVGCVVECGDAPGAGQAVKIVNQYLVTANLATTAEALGLAKAMGLDLDFVLQQVSAGAGSSWALQDRGPRMIMDPADRPPLTRLSILAKDAGLVHDTARVLGYDDLILSAVAHRWQDALQAGLGEHDDSAIFDVMRSPAARAAHATHTPAVGGRRNTNPEG